MPGRIAFIVSVISCAALLTSAGFAAAIGPNWAGFVAACGLIGVLASWVLAFAVARHHIRVLARMAKLLQCENDEVSVMLSLFAALRKRTAV